MPRSAKIPCALRSCSDSELQGRLTSSPETCRALHCRRCLQRLFLAHAAANWRARKRSLLQKQLEVFIRESQSIPKLSRPKVMTRKLSTRVQAEKDYSLRTSKELFLRRK